jgi:cytochrome c oxidase subunit 4
VNDIANLDHRAHHTPHALPARVLLGTAAALVALTAATVITSRIDLGALNVVLALAIAAGKAAVVALFFMHLRYEHRSLAVVLGAATLFAVLLVAFVIFDTVQYQPSIREQEARTQAQKQAQAPVR